MRKVIATTWVPFLLPGNTRAVLFPIAFFLFNFSAKSHVIGIGSKANSGFNKLDSQEFAIATMLCNEI